MDKKDFWRTAVVDGKENPRYKVSRDGRIICLNWKRMGKPRLCKLTANGQGYLMVGIDGVLKRVHRIVAETFIPNPEFKPCIDHINTVRTDNRVENLRWVTQRENCNNPLSRKNMSENAPKLMLDKFGAEHNRSIQIVQLSLDRKFIKKWDAAMEVQRELGIKQGNISSCCRGRLKQTGGFRWMFYSDWLKTRRKKSLKDIKPLFV